MGLCFVSDGLVDNKGQLRINSAGQCPSPLSVKSNNDNCYILLHSNPDSIAKETGQSIITNQKEN